jgi:DNA invertase Pin-like site-specific DNA recombinase
VTEVESGKRADRPGLAQALTECRLRGATLIVAKLDRLSRNLAFIAKLIEGNVPVVAADAPDAPVLNLQMLAMIAQWEREMISKRTKEALARSTKKLGGNRENLTRSAIKRGAKTSAARRKAKAAARAGDVMNKIDGLRREGASSLREIAAALNAKEIAAPRGGAWSATQVMRVIERTSQEQAR